METCAVTGPGLLVWSSLVRPESLTDSLSARPAVPEIDARVLAAVSSIGTRHLLVQLLDDDPGYQDLQTRGLRVRTQVMRVGEGETARYVDIECTDAAGHAALDIVAHEIASALRNSIGQPGTVVARVLGKWRRFWGSTGAGILSPAEQVGLFGELWFLATWLLPEVGTSCVTAWCGPRGLRHDFQAPGLAVEVKTTTASRPLHRIAGLEQLANPADGELLLFSLQIREEPSASNSLGTLVEHLNSAFKDDAVALDAFESGLARLGVIMQHLPEYRRQTYRVATEALYLVAGEFPRLTNASLVGGRMPAGVESLAYDITLQGSDSLRLDRGADAVKARLRMLRHGTRI